MLTESVERSYVFGPSILVLFSSLAALSYLGGLIGIDNITSLSFAISIALVIGLAFLDVLVCRKVDLKLIIVMALMVVAVLQDGIKFNFDYYKSFLITLCTFICISYAPKVKANEWCRRIISCVFFSLALITLFVFYFRGYDAIYFGSTNSIAFNFDNPNAAGLWLFGIFMINGCFLFERKGIIKIAYILILVGLLHVIFKTESRNSLVAAMAFLVVIFLQNRIKNKKIPKWVLFLAVVIPAIVIFVYMYAFLPVADSLSGVLGINKGLDTREKVWSSVLKVAKDFLLFGRYELYNGGNLHNSLLTLFGSYGLPFTIVACWLMYKSAALQQGLISPLATMAFCALMLSGCFEASVFVGVGGFYLVILIIPACFLTKLQNSNEEG